LYSKKSQSVLRKHPWVFSGAIDLASEELEDGDLVTVNDHKSQFLARGHFQNATIAVRVLTFEDVPVDEAFFVNRITNAVNVRRNLALFTKENTICRLVHGEGDSLPGLIIDFYNGVAVIQCHSIGMYKSLDMIVEGL